MYDIYFHLLLHLIVYNIYIPSEIYHSILYSYQINKIKIVKKKYSISY